jgi:hypothetical protein
MVPSKFHAHLPCRYYIINQPFLQAFNAVFTASELRGRTMQILVHPWLRSVCPLVRRPMRLRGPTGSRFSMLLSDNSFIASPWHRLLTLRTNQNTLFAVWQEAVRTMRIVFSSGLAERSTLEPLKRGIRDRLRRTFGNAETALVTELIAGQFRGQLKFGSRAHNPEMHPRQRNTGQVC